MEAEIAHLFYILKSSIVMKGKKINLFQKKEMVLLSMIKGKKDFWKNIKSIYKSDKFWKYKVLIIASPGFTKDDFTIIWRSKLKIILKNGTN